MNELAEFWSKVGARHDRVVGLQIGSNAGSMVLQRVADESRLGHLYERSARGAESVAAEWRSAFLRPESEIRFLPFGE